MTGLGDPSDGVSTSPAGASPLGSEIDKLAATAEQDLLTWRRHLHQHPELSNREFETAKYVAERLRSTILGKFAVEPGAFADEPRGPHPRAG